VNPAEVTLLTVPAAPPAAGPERALDPWPPDPKPPAGGLAWVPGVLLLAAGEALLAVAATIPYEPAPITTAVIPAAMTLLRMLENICLTPVRCY
jgi:hypothetical protein